MKIVYGPVPSWRLGRSLGVDALGGTCKRCTFDCTYCQLGPTPQGPVPRGAWVDPAVLAEELWEARDVPADYVTFSGMGEPTLATNLDALVSVVRKFRDTSVAILTNASLLAGTSVQSTLKLVDEVILKLDAADEQTFLAVNRPRIPCTVAEIVEGIRSFRGTFGGRLALQMMFIEANVAQAEQLAALARRLRPDEVELNTPLRPSATPPLSPEKMAQIARLFEGLPIRQVYEAPRPTVLILDPVATRLRRPEEGVVGATGAGAPGGQRPLG